MSGKTPNRYRSIILLLLMVVLFGYGLIKLFLLRFEAGDVYPAYSSLRGDPLGIQVLFEGLRALSPDQVTRNFEAYDRMAIAADQTFLVCGLKPHKSWFFKGRSAQKLITGLEENGGRMVIAFAATSRRSEDEDEDQNEDQDEDAVDEERQEREEVIKEDPCGGAPAEDDNAAGQDDDAGQDDAETNWNGFTALGFSIESAGGRRPEAVAYLAAKETPLTLPRSLPWRGVLYFEDLDASWRTVYTRAQRPVVIERDFGRGSLVLAADSYLFSNEAMRKDRFASLIAWCLIPERAVIVDETHHGLVRRPGIAALMRKYHLHGVVGAVLVIALLTIWKHAVVFAPRPPETEKSGGDRSASVGRDTIEGLVNLMHQHIAPGDLIRVCVEIWQTSPLIADVPDKRLEMIGGLMEKHTRDPREHGVVDTYRQLCKLIEQGKVL